MPRQKRGMDVERRSLREAEQLTRNHLPVRDEQQAIRRKVANRACRFIGSQPARREDGGTGTACELGDRRRAQLEPATGRPIGLAHDEELIGQVSDAREEGNAECTGAEEGDAPDARH